MRQQKSLSVGFHGGYKYAATADASTTRKSFQKQLKTRVWLEATNLVGPGGEHSLHEPPSHCSSLH